VIMNEILRNVVSAYARGSGRELGETLSPLAGGSSRVRQELPSRPYIGSAEIRDRLSDLTEQNPIFTKAEANAWSDVYAAHWATLVELFKIANNQDGSPQRVYDCWKEVTSALVKGYTSNTFPSWTVPCLYIVGRYLRTFAQHADHAEPNGQGTTFESNMKDDIVTDTSKNERLEDTARIINRIFTMCISDRYVVGGAHCDRAY
jgi:hypothetical protein